jgi:MoaA/NifB/PqqE/SkfB family radical SAM enzyme
VVGPLRRLSRATEAPLSGRIRWAYKRLYDGVNHRLRTAAGGRWAAHCRPTSIVILLTERCNAACIHCDIWKNRGKEDAPAPERWKAVLTEMRDWLGPVHVALSGGEALLRPATIDLVAHGAASGLFVEILTHGFWDDQSRIERLALARPWRVTVSLDAIGETHTRIRGREYFFDKTERTIETLRRIRKDQTPALAIRLKTVVMAQNLDEVCEVARYAERLSLEVFYQPIEQNYNTVEDPRWFDRSETWPKDPDRASAVVGELVRLKKQGLPIANSNAQLESMIPYFRNPDANRVAVQSHIAHERRLSCSALTTLQLQANGDVTVCTGAKPVGNVKLASLREIWEGRPRLWENGCCLERRLTDTEKVVRLRVSARSSPRP